MKGILTPFPAIARNVPKAAQRNLPSNAAAAESGSHPAAGTALEGRYTF
jgi:hypothetical protein